MRLAPGVRLGAYEIVAPLGAGGMGEVYRARDTNLDRAVALKVLPGELAGRPDAMARFAREAKALAALSHPNILAIYDFGTDQGTTFAVMELLEGETLRVRLAGGAPPVRKAAEWALNIAQGLAAAHEVGIVHRDLKPENVFVTSDGRIKLLDFGLARQEPRVADSEASSPTMTRQTEPGTLLGTAGYMSPEQVRGQPADARSDIFSFGVVLYEMLSGQRPFRGESAVETLNAVLKDEPPPPSTLRPSVPPQLDQLVLHCLEKRPQERFQSARDLAFDLSLLSGSASDVSARFPPGALRGPRAAATGIGLLALGVLAGLSLARAGRTTPASAPRAPSFVQITDTPGVEGEPSLAPDGKSFVYISRATGNSDVYFRRVGGGKAINLTEDSAGDDWQPAFSPDGERIAFRSEREGGGIFVMGATGESVRRLTDFGHHPSWSPDGQRIAVSSVVFPYPTDRPALGQLWVVDVASAGRRPLAEGMDAVQPSWSPHGSRIAFWGLRSGGGQRDIWTVAADGSAPAPVAVTDDAFLDWNPVWSPDGQYLYFSSNRGGTMNVWRVAVDETSGAVRGQPEAVTTPSSWSGGLSFSRDGRLAYGTLEWRSSLMRVAFDPAAEVLIGTPAPILRSTQPIRDHQVSPDGRWLVFSRVGAREDLFIVALDGGSYRALTEDVFRDRAPVWSPDGRRIAFYSDRGGAYELWAIKPDGSGLASLTRGGNSPQFPVWSPDGSRLAASSSRGGAYLIDVSSGSETPLSPLPLAGEGFAFWPTSWSRDGSKVAGLMLSVTGDVAGIASYTLHAGDFQQLLTNTVYGWMYPLWLGDGRRLLLRDRDGIALLDTRTGRLKRLMAVGGYHIGLSVGLTRDDRLITFTETGTEGDVWLMTVQ